MGEHRSSPCAIANPRTWFVSRQRAVPLPGTGVRALAEPRAGPWRGVAADRHRGGDGPSPSSGRAGAGVSRATYSCSARSSAVMKCLLLRGDRPAGAAMLAAIEIAGVVVVAVAGHAQRAQPCARRPAAAGVLALTGPTLRRPALPRLRAGQRPVLFAGYIVVAHRVHSAPGARRPGRGGRGGGGHPHRAAAPAVLDPVAGVGVGVCSSVIPYRRRPSPTRACR